MKFKKEWWGNRRVVSQRLSTQRASGLFCSGAGG
jgi:hypothetical protein